MELVKLTKSFADKAIAPAGKDQVFFRDKEIRGFALRVTSSGTKSFVVEKMIDHKVRRITLGKYGALTAETARKEAQKLLGKIASGNNPIAEKQATKMRAVTLNEAFADYLKARKALKQKTVYDYNRVLTIGLDKWRNTPLISITKDKVEKLHETLGKERGEAYANLVMRVLHAIFNFAAGKYEDSQGRSLIVENPVRRLSQTRAWYRVERRKTHIKAHELASWYNAVTKLDNEILRDYLLLVIFTGLRRQEAAKLTWDKINLQSKTLTISDTKNNEEHILPLSDFLFDMLTQRKNTTASSFVFPGSGAGGYIVEPRKQVAKVISASGITFSVHDLRRTFITIAESLDIPAYALKRLLNHKMRNDVTSGYIMTDVERLRKPMQLISDFLSKSMGIKNTPVITFETQGKMHES